jgi:hypothetical protein
MASRYWVGGTGTWDSTNTANWSTTTGGASGASVPAAADTAYFDSNSGSGTVTIDGTAPTITSCRFETGNLIYSLSGNANISTGTTLFWENQLNLNNFTLTCGAFSSSVATTRAINFGTGKIVITGSNGVILEIFNVTGYSYTGTPRIELNYSGGIGTRTIRFGDNTGTATQANTPDIYVTAGTDIVRLFTNAVTTAVRTLDTTGFSGSIEPSAFRLFGSLNLSATTTVTATANAINFISTQAGNTITTNGVAINRPVTFNGVGGGWQLSGAMSIGATRTLTLTNGALDLNSQTLSTGLFSSSNSNTRSILFGTGNITTTGSGTVWTTATVTNFSRTGTPTVNISNNSATATTVSTGAMTEAQSLTFNYTTGTYTLTDTAAVYRSVNFTGFAGTIPNSVRTIFGSLTVSTGMTLTAGANATTFASTAAGNTITTNSKTFDFPLIFNGIGGLWAFQDALTQGSTRTFTITNGTVQLKDGVTSTVGSFVANNTAVKFLQSTTPGSQATLSQAAGTVNVVDLTIQDINAVGGASWNAYTDFENTDAGNNDGWNFSLSPPYSIAELPVTLRPFTQPRRF